MEKGQKNYNQKKKKSMIIPKENGLFNKKYSKA